MVTQITTLLAALVVAASVAIGVSAGQPPQKPEKKRPAEQPLPIAELQKILRNTLIETKDFPAEMSLAKLLESLQKHLPADKKIEFRLDSEAFGKDADAVAKAPITFPPFPSKMSLATLLRFACSKVRPEDYEKNPDCRFAPGQVTMTSWKRAAYTMEYDISVILREARQLHAELARISARLSPPDSWPREHYFHDLDGLDPADGRGLVMRVIAREYEDADLRFENETRLVAHARWNYQNKIADELEGLRRLTVSPVVMNAQLFELEDAFYSKEIAPLFADTNKSPGKDQVAPVYAPLIDKLSKQKLVLKGDPIKIRLRTRTAFLSFQESFQYRALLDEPKGGNARFGLAGVTMLVEAVESSDRRSLWLQITRDTSQLLELTKEKFKDEKTGKTAEYEIPRLKNTLSTSRCKIEDLQSILMVVDYLPMSSASKGKKLALLARPEIWIEEEKELIRQGEMPETPPVAEKPKKVEELPQNDECKQVLQALIADVLTNPRLKDAREYYGTRGDKRFTLVDDFHLAWPKGFGPDVAGYELYPINPSAGVPANRILGIAIDTFRKHDKKPGWDGATFGVSVMQVGGGNSSFRGGTEVMFKVRRIEGKFVVEPVSPGFYGDVIDDGESPRLGQIQSNRSQ